ncbi:MAG: glgC [Holophagaceae bacterium]|nr:glgC [Holophagaceae bacterium]
MPAHTDVLAVILGGGRGSRLYPLTSMRSKPAVPIAGKYRLIDIPISNCINSGIFKVHVLTQFNSVSLHRHITNTYKFDAFHTGFVEVLAAEQTPTSEAWYQGTADAFRKQLFEIQAARVDHVLVLAGDHLYRMNYSYMIAHHLKTDADITVAVQPVLTEEAHRFGILKREVDGRIVDFVEKPKDPATLERMKSRDDVARPFLGSMGIYVFKVSALIDLLTEHPDYDDFGSDVIPHAIRHRPVQGFDFDGYWEDIGTIRSFYDTNLKLTVPNAPFNFYDAKAPIYTHSRFLPGSILTDSHIDAALITEGCVIDRARIIHSIVGLRSLVGAGSLVKDSILMGADYYDSRTHDIGMGIGEGCHIEGAILDKNVRVGHRTQIRPFPRGTEMDHGSFVVQDGIVVIPKGTILPPDTQIGPSA